jgi:hypothetical protein
MQQSLHLRASDLHVVIAVEASVLGRACYIMIKYR